MTVKTFSATLEAAGKGLWIAMPFDPNQEWGQKERHHISGTLNEHRVRGPLEQHNGIWRLALGPAWRRDSGLEAGMQVRLSLTPEGPQVETLAEDIVAALNNEPAARSFFEALATFYRKGYLRWIDGARKPDLRAARIAEMVSLLKEGRKERQK